MYVCLKVIVESVDSICRNSADTQYQYVLIQKISQNLKLVITMESWAEFVLMVHTCTLPYWKKSQSS